MTENTQEQLADSLTRRVRKYVAEGADPDASAFLEALIVGASAKKLQADSGAAEYRRGYDDGWLAAMKGTP